MLKDKADLPVAYAGELIGVEAAYVLLSKKSLPDVGRSKQPIRFMSVDFPDPDGPMIAAATLFDHEV